MKVLFLLEWASMQHAQKSFILQQVYVAHMSPTLNRSSVLQHFDRSNAVEIRNGTMVDFYPGLLHMCFFSSYRHS